MSNPIVTFEMESGGKMVAELYPEVAPNTVNNFISLIKKGFFDGLIFHRVIPGFMIQGGDPQGSGMGVLSMARSSNPDSAGSQFFIMVDPAPHLDGQYAAFGKVIEGMEVADAIVSTPTGWGDKPKTPQRMKTVTVDTQGQDYPEPKKA